jgi:hypothetical protein
MPLRDEGRPVELDRRSFMSSTSFRPAAEPTAASSALDDITPLFVPTKVMIALLLLLLETPLALLLGSDGDGDGAGRRAWRHSVTYASTGFFSRRHRA